MGDWVGNPNPYAYIPDPFLDYTHHMSFLERLVNTLRGVYSRIGQQLYNLPRQEAVMRQYFNYTDDIPPLSELVRNTSLLLLNNHFSLNYPKPLVPNMIEVGGMHVEPPKKLPEVRPVTVSAELTPSLTQSTRIQQQYDFIYIIVQLHVVMTLDIYIITCVSVYRWGLDWRIELLTTYSS
jgi:hypothetical protein